MTFILVNNFFIYILEPYINLEEQVTGNIKRSEMYLKKCPLHRENRGKH